MYTHQKSTKLKGVCYDIRGPVLEKAEAMEKSGEKIIKLNIGNPAPFGLLAAEEVVQSVVSNINKAQGYCGSKGILEARQAIAEEYQKKNIPNVSNEDIFIGNGVSELIMMTMQALLNNGMEILLPAPDYPLWTAAVTLAGGKPVHYLCDEENGWQPDLDDIEKKITKKTCGIVVINPNNPTGAVYSQEVLEKIVDLARQHGLIIFADEIYDKILYDGTQHIPLASLADDVLFLTFGGMSKNYRLAGFRVGWLVISGDKKGTQDYLEGINMLASMRLCSNVPAQFAIQKALSGYQDIYDLTAKTGRLYQQRETCFNLLTQIPGISCTKPQAAFYLFPHIDAEKFNIKDDEQFVLDFLEAEKVLLVQGTAFNWPQPDHFRIVFLPEVNEIEKAISALANFLLTYKQ